MDQIKEFNLDQLANNPHILIVGKRSSGKSSLAAFIVDFLKSRNASSDIFVNDPTAKYQTFYQSKFPNAFVSTETDDKIYRRLASNSKTNDIIVVENVNKEFELATLQLENKYDNKSLISCLQYPYSNHKFFDYVFLFKDFCKEKLYKTYGGIFPSYDTFASTFDSVTNEPHAALVINTKALDRNLEDNVFRFKAPLVKEC